MKEKNTNRLLLTGTASLTKKIELLQNCFSIDCSEEELTDQFVKTYDLQNDKELVVCIELNTLKYDRGRDEFKDKARHVDSILLVEPLEPRPATLISNLKILNSISLTKTQLNQMHILFYKELQSSQTNLNENNLENFRIECLQFDQMFKELNIHSNEQKRQFVWNNCWLWSEVTNESGLIKGDLKKYFANFHYPIEKKSPQVTLKKDRIMQEEASHIKKSWLESFLDQFRKTNNPFS